MKNEPISFDQIFNYYNDDLSAFKLVHGIRGRILYYSFLLLYIIVSAFIIYQTYLTKSYYWSLWIVPLAFPIIPIVNYYAKKNLRELGIKISKGWFTHWANDHYRKYKLNKFIEELTRLKVISNQKSKSSTIKYLIKMASDKAMETKKTLLINGGFFMLLFVPLWSAFIGWFYLHLDVSNFKDATNFFFIITGLIVLITFVVLFAKLVIEDYFNAQNRRYLAFKSALENVLLNFRTPN